MGDYGTDTHTHTLSCTHTYMCNIYIRTFTIHTHACTPTNNVPSGLTRVTHLFSDTMKLTICFLWNGKIAQPSAR